ncbi:MAG TPA: TlpA disulfide reductase family protein [Puia sp.]
MPPLQLGDAAPPLHMREWLKGKPVLQFEKGTVYVVEFWATWCIPCKAAIPRLSKLASKYKKKVIVIGIDIYEMKTTPVEKVKFFVDSMRHHMKYRVATEDSNFMETGWLDASGEQGIPKTFVVNAEGRLAWIGHPVHLHEVLSRIVNNDWNINEALAKKNSNRYLEELDDSLNYELNTYEGDYKIPGDFGKPDSAILRISEIIGNEPKLKYAPLMASHTFSALLKTNSHKAYEYGKEVLITPTYEEPAYDRIIYDIEWWSDKITLAPEIYELGAEAYQLEADQIKQYQDVYNPFRLYNKMAEWYWRAGDKSKAIHAQKKAIKALRRKK